MAIERLDRCHSVVILTERYQEYLRWKSEMDSLKSNIDTLKEGIKPIEMQSMEKERIRRLNEMKRFDILKNLTLSNIFSLYEQALF